MATAIMSNPLNQPAAEAAGQTSSPIVLRFGPHLFITGDSNHINEQHQGRLSIPLSRQEAWLALLRDRAAVCRGAGADFLFLLAPDKQSVYRHLLPPSYTARPATFLREHPEVIDVAPALAALAQTTDVYPVTDSHWNHVGAFVAALAVQSRRQQNLPDILFRWGETMHPGDLGNKLDPVEHSSRPIAKFRKPAVLLHDNMVPNNGRVRIFARVVPPGAEPRRLLLFGDSFSYEIIEFLKEFYDVTVQVHSAAMDHALLAAFRPHLVITELTERFVFRLPEVSDGDVLPVLWMQKIARRERLLPARGATPEQAVALPASARAVLTWIEALFDPYRRHLRPEASARTEGGPHGDPATTLWAEIDRLTASPELAERPQLVQELLRGLVPETPMPSGSLALALYAASSRPAETAAILAAVPQLNELTVLAVLPGVLHVMALTALRIAHRYRQLLVCLRSACSRSPSASQASGQVVAFALDTLCRLRPRRHRLIEAALADRLAATALLGSTEHHVLCRYLLDVGRLHEAAARLRLFIAECDADPWPVLALARLLRSEGNLEGAQREVTAAWGRMPAQLDLAALNAQLA